MCVQVHFNDQSGQFAAGLSLFECAEALGVKVPTSCRKQGRCKECLVEITAGMEALSPVEPEERHLRDNFRLACRCRLAQDDAHIRCHTLRRGELRIERHALPSLPSGQPLRLEPAVRREGDRILLDGVEIDRRGGPLYGMAMDLGTTTVVLRLLNLESGEIVGDAAFENPQRFGGSDVMARIQYDTEDGSKLLQRTLAAYLSHTIEDFGVDPLSIYEMTVAANSTMRDLFFRLSIYSIGQNPYQSITEQELAAGRRKTTSLVSAPGPLHVPMHPRGRVYGLPVISGHVGADAAACLLAVNWANEDRLVALMDLGTNTELLLGNRHRILAASCPAGPAFEGGRISCGMPGLTGAIEKFRFDPGGSVRIETIGGVQPEGICGSGLVDVLSELLRTGRMNALGRLVEGEAFVLDTPGTEPILLTESDINQLAQAKGANAAGLHVLFDCFGIRFDEVETFYLAGGFGRHLEVSSAKRIGLIPHIDESKINQIGNASIEGASLALLSIAKRAEVERLVKQVTHCRLETHPRFFDYFVEGCQFNPVTPLPHVSPV